MEQNENIPPRYAIRLRDLREWHVVTATCFRCRRQTILPTSVLTWERASYTHLLDLERKLRCTHCGNRCDNRLSVRAAPRN